MDFTREPIIESVITPKEGCKLVIRSSKGAGQEEFFVDAVEVVSFGNTFFLRSMERPKAFLVPAADYEILEVRETRMVLKNVGLDRSIKIGGGKEPSKKQQKEQAKAEQEKSVDQKPEPKKREKRRHYRRRKGRDKIADESSTEDSKINLPEPKEVDDDSPQDLGEPLAPNPQILGSLLPPPPTLISETIERYKDNALFKDVFYSEEEIAEEQAKVEEVSIDESVLEEVSESKEVLPEEEVLSEPEPAVEVEETEETQETNSIS